MLFFKEKKDGKMVDSLLSVKSHPDMLSKLIVLQNEISVSYNTKVLVITSIGEDVLAAAFAKGLADAYAANGSNYLLIDANLYNPRLANMLGEDAGESGVKKDEEVLLPIKGMGDNNGVLFMTKETYPSDIYKSGAIHDLIKKSAEKYEHIIVLTPSIKEHKEVVLFKNILDSVLLITRRDQTKKRNIFEALVYFEEHQIPVSKTVVLK